MWTLFCPHSGLREGLVRHLGAHGAANGTPKRPPPTRKTRNALDHRTRTDPVYKMVLDPVLSPLSRATLHILLKTYSKWDPSALKKGVSSPLGPNSYTGSGGPMVQWIHSIFTGPRDGLGPRVQTSQPGLPENLNMRVMRMSLRTTDHQHIIGEANDGILDGT